MVEPVIAFENHVLPHRRAGLSLGKVFRESVFVYLVCLLFFYPYGIEIANGVNLRVPDLVGAVTVFFGVARLAFNGSIRYDVGLLVVLGPFVLLEFFTPVIGGLAYRQPADMVSAIRLLLLWLPILLLAATETADIATRVPERFSKLLRITLVLNLVYAVVQIMSDLGVVPSAILPTLWLEQWAVDRHFDVVEGMRPAGFFVNTTSLSVFGILALSFFLSRYIVGRSTNDFTYVALSVLAVVLTTSRIAFLAMILILSVAWILLPTGKKALLTGLLAVLTVSVLVLVESTVGVDVAFSRFTRVLESGLLYDVSLGARINIIWPEALHAARNYPYGTLISAARAVPLIDSGYLTYFIQGRSIFVAAVVMLIAGMGLIGAASLWRMRRRSAHLAMMFVAIYLAVAMTISNPLRSPLVIFFVSYIFWMVSRERHVGIRSHVAVMRQQGLS